MNAPPLGGAKLKSRRKAIPTIAGKDTKDHRKYITNQIKSRLDDRFASSVKRIE
jgi:hypothetical protein